MYICSVTWMALCGVIVVCVCGCGEQQTRLPVAGRVLIDGEPLTTGSIQFVPETGRPFASKILEDGSFRLAELSVANESQQPGISQGKYRIAVSSAEVLGEDRGDILRHVPAHYADFRKSDLEVEITESQENLIIELTWEGFEETEEVDEAEETEEVEEEETAEAVAEGSSIEAAVQETEAAKEE